MKRSFWVRLMVIVPLLSGIILPVFNQQRAVAQAAEHTVFLPLVSLPVGPIIPETTVILTEDTTQHLESVSADSSVYTFSQMTPELAQLDPNDVMVSDVSANTPNGFLRRVTDIQEISGMVEVTTVQGTLEEAIEQGELSVSMTLLPSMISKETALEGVNLVSGTQAAFSYNLVDVILYDADGNNATTGDQVLANGALSFDMSTNFDLSIGFFSLKELYYSISVAETAGLTITSNVNGASLEEEYVLASYRLAPYTVFIAQFPVVFIPTIALMVGIDGEIQVGITTSVTQELGVSAGLGYRDGEWGTDVDFNNYFTFSNPTISPDVNFKGYLGPQLVLELYGVAGPYARAQAFLQLEVDPYSWWGLFGGLEIPIGVQVEVFGRGLADYSTTALNLRWLLAGSVEAGTSLTAPEGIVERDL